ncbi:putative baseplate assembly protein [Streptomyces paludis]|uniref:Putative baseplate assembly protein n=1 Tax=Streptomyces paludis TaxID=2282738 RepID=A0A345HYX2_9ACTN|nr:putative baseplate assembly protein [Streptomyces paludis]AXG81896.1 putative baseplate assembly protein [Streptomyces paludis]
MSEGCRCGAGSGDCCTGIEPRTPFGRANSPGLPQIAYRTGDHHAFWSSMLARLSSPAYPELRDLLVRTPDDAALSWLDAWAVLGDLLGFHTERVANEGYLRTATRADSLLLFGRLVGHTPRPGVGAGVYLAYRVDRDRAVTVPAGSRAQSVPGTDQEPQSFETVEDLAARAAWNDLKVRLRRPYPVRLRADRTIDRREVHLAGAGARLQTGDRLLFVFGTEPGRQALDVVQASTVDEAQGITSVLMPGAKLPTFTALQDRFRDTVAELLEDDKYRTSRIVRRYVDAVLVPLRDRLPSEPDPTESVPVILADRDEDGGDPDAITTPTGFARALNNALQLLEESLAAAAPYPAVHDFLTALRTDLTGIRTQAGRLEPEQDRPTDEDETLFDKLALARFVATGNGATGNGSRGAQPAEDDPALLGLAALIGSLRKPLTPQPSSARALRLDPADVFGTGSDAGVRLLTALDPRLASLYEAWRNVNLTKPLPLAGLQTMRTVATPFGATAPLQPDYADNGRIVGHIEWPLTGSKSLTFTVEYDDGEPKTLIARWIESGSPVGESKDLPFDGSIRVGPLEVRVTTTTPDDTPATVALRCWGNDIARAVTFTGPKPHSGTPYGKSTVEVAPTFGADPASVGKDLEPGEEETTTHGGVNVVLGRAERADDPDRVTVALTTTGTVSPKVLLLDAVYPGIGPESWVVIERPGAVPSLQKLITRVETARVVSQADFGITGKVTELTLADAWLGPQDTQLSQIRRTTVYAGGEPLTVATEPIPDDVAGGVVELAELYDELEPGRWVIVAGERTDIPDTPGVKAAELAMVSGVSHAVDPAKPGDPVHTTITLAGPLAYTYRRTTVTIHGNVVRADAGATRDEPIGSGDAGQAGQTFTLFAAPLTWLPADNPRGARSTLQVRVDGVLWQEVDSLAGQPPTAKVYVTSTGEGGRTMVGFGDGVHGARLPTGHENVRARYRVGTGAAGNVAADTVTTPLTRPLGVTAVTNPLPAGGGADPDGLRQTRRQTPLAVAALDRLVGITDYEDFTRSRAGIGRAAARRIFGGRELMHVTIAGAGDITLDEDGEVVRSLRSALALYGDPQLPVRVDVRELVLLVMSAGLKIAPDQSYDLVEPKVRRALLERLGFDSRELGQPAYLSEAIAAAQAVPGVEYVDVDVFAGVPGSMTPAGLQKLASTLTTPNPMVPARQASYTVEYHDVRPPAGSQPASYSESLTLVAARNGISVAELLRLNPGLPPAEPLPAGTRVVVFAGIRPAQLVRLSPAVPTTLILKEVRR